MKKLRKICFPICLGLLSCGQGDERTDPTGGKSGSGSSTTGSGCTPTPKSTTPTALNDPTNQDTIDINLVHAAYSLATPITFSKNIEKTITNSCLECHSSKNKKQAPLLDTYDQVKKAAVKSLPLLKARKMPPSTGTNMPNSTEIQNFEIWISDGLLFGADPDRPQTPPAGTAYNNAIRDFLENNCISCHKADNSQPPILTSYDKAVESGTKSLVSLQAGTMPPKSSKKPASIELFASWSAKEFPLAGDGIKDAVSDPSTKDPETKDTEKTPCAANP